MNSLIKLFKEKQAAVEYIEEQRRHMEEIAHAIWEYAELGLKEYKSSTLLADTLEQNGFQLQRGIARMPTAFIGTFGDGKPVIGIIAEYDALPGLSNFPVPYRKPLKEGAPGHGCGHNLFGTASIGAALALKRVMEDYSLSGTVKVLGTPAEEVCIGKPYMARDGFFKGFDAFLDWHPDTITTAYYKSCNAYNSVKFVFYGISAHGNRPWLGKSALEAAELMGVAVNFLRGHLHPGNPPLGATTINYTYTECGEYPNVIPEKAEAWYVYRAPTRQELEQVHSRVVNCAKGAALATDTECEVRVITGTHQEIPNQTMAQIIYQNIKLVGPPKFEKKEEDFAKKLQRAYGKPTEGLAKGIVPPSGGARAVTDSSEVTWFAPYGVARVTCRPLGIPGHSWGATASHGMSIGYKGMIVAAKILALSGIDLIMNPRLLEKAKKEFQEKTKDLHYKSAIPESAIPGGD